MVRFTTKKIDSLTLGERMKKIRDERRLSLVDISKGTKIQTKYLEYLEVGEYTKLPADVYVKGFLRSYAVFMGLNEVALIKQFEREKGIHRNIKKLPDEGKPGKPLDFSGLVITPKIIVATSVVLVTVLAFVYLYKEVSSFVSNPRLVILKPIDGSTVDGNSVHITGIAEKDAMVFINDQSVLVDENGDFSQDVGLKEGVNIINVKAKNKFEKEASQSVTINANYQNQAPVEQQAAPEESTSEKPVTTIENKNMVSAEVYVKSDSTWLSVQADGNLVYSGVLLPDSTQKFDANESVTITSGNGKATHIKINGKDMGVLGSDNGIVRDVTYTASGKNESKKN